MTTTETSLPAGAEAALAPASGLPGAALRRVLEHIDANLHRDPRLAELSALAHMSTFHFARLFKRSTGLSPHRFVVARRIDHAKELLAVDGPSIAAISGTVGFRTASHFTTVFRRSTGVTPSAYRSAAHASAPKTSTAVFGPALSVESSPGVDPNGRSV
jgi:AraC family transcriptional regulator